MTDDERHAAVVERFPGGLTPTQFKQVTLESADEDGRVYPPSLADYWAAWSLLMGMAIEGLIHRRVGPKLPGPFYITDKGREMLATSTREKR